MLQRICSTESAIFKQRFQLRPCASNTFFEICKFSFRFNSFQWKIKSLTRENLYLFFQKRKKKTFPYKSNVHQKAKNEYCIWYIYYFPKKHLPEEINYFCLGFLWKEKNYEKCLFIYIFWVYLFIYTTNGLFFLELCCVSIKYNLLYFLFTF